MNDFATQLNTERQRHIQHNLNIQDECNRKNALADQSYTQTLVRMGHEYLARNHLLPQGEEPNVQLLVDTLTDYNVHGLDLAINDTIGAAQDCYRQIEKEQNRKNWIKWGLSSLTTIAGAAYGVLSYLRPELNATNYHPAMYAVFGVVESAFVADVIEKSTWFKNYDSEKIEQIKEQAQDYIKHQKDLLAQQESIPYAHDAMRAFISNDPALLIVERDDKPYKPTLQIMEIMLQKMAEPKSVSQISLQ